MLCHIILNLCFILFTVTLECKHSFCNLCLLKMENFNENSRCPLCREEIKDLNKLTIDVQLQQEIKNKQPIKFQIQYNELLKQRQLEQDYEKFTIVYGNDHFNLNQNKHDWTCYLKMKDYNSYKYIENVEFELHHTFKNPKVTIKHFPFQIHQIGWGCFNIPITIYWKNKSITKLDHFLSFEGKGIQLTKTVKIAF